MARNGLQDSIGSSYSVTQTGYIFPQEITPGAEDVIGKSLEARRRRSRPNTRRSPSKNAPRATCRLSSAISDGGGGNPQEARRASGSRSGGAAPRTAPPWPRPRTGSSPASANWRNPPINVWANARLGSSNACYEAKDQIQRAAEIQAGERALKAAEEAQGGAGPPGSAGRPSPRRSARTSISKERSWKTAALSTRKVGPPKKKAEGESSPCV